MDMRQIAALLALRIFCSCPAWAETTEQSRAQEIFGVSWSITSGELEKKFPGGTWGTYGGMLPIYTVKDGRPLFGVERTSDQTIIYGFSTRGKLAGININFPADLEAYGDLLEALTVRFGSAATSIQRANANLESIQSVWEDKGLRIILSHAFAGDFVRNDLIVLQPTLLAESWRNFGLK